MEQQAISERLDRIEEALKNIQETISDPDTILTYEESQLLDQSIINQREGKLVSLEELKNARNNSR
jgi:transcriptional regulator CtsR